MPKKKPSSGIIADNVSPASTPAKDAPAQQPETAANTPLNESFYIAGIGASAGGLEALKQFFSHMPPENGLAFVVIQHFDPNAKSILAEILQKITRMKVSDIENGIRIQPNHVYIVPSGKYAIISGNIAFLEDDKETSLHIKPIDNLFISLAQNQENHTAGIILSGTGTDGAAGIQAIKMAGGITLVQDPDSAQFDGMPKCAIATGSADFVLPPQEIPRELLDCIKNRISASSGKTHASVVKNYRSLKEIINIVLKKTGHNFSHYKKTTLARRVEKRMSQNGINSITKYVSLLRQDPDEANELFRELSITFTHFFREMENDFVLKEKVFSEICKNKSPGETIRIWAPGCATGEEPYSIAMLFAEYMETTQQHFKVQIFATDINENAIHFARAAAYSQDSADHISPTRLTRFFHKKDRSFIINDRIREMVLFSCHNIIKDPPFSKMDIISCKNLLIYFDAALQDTLLPLLFYVLRPNGFLLLGKSESIRRFSDLFTTIDEKNRIFKRKGASLSPPKSLAMHSENSATLPPKKENNAPMDNPMSIQEHLSKVLLEEFSPPCVIINEEHTILHIHGRLERFLSLPKGEPHFNIMKLARKEIRMELMSAIKNAIRQKKSAYSEEIHEIIDGYPLIIKIAVRPFANACSKNSLYMIIFQEQLVSERSKKKTFSHATEFGKELDNTKKLLYDLIEQLEDSNDTLKQANEAAREKEEELRSTKEELETTKEELQSMNEELNIINTELQHKIDDLSKANNDIDNLLTSTNIGTVFLDRNLCIKRFTPAATKFLNIIDADIGRPIHHLNTFLITENLIETIEKVLKTLLLFEKEIRIKHNLWFLVRFLPYQTESHSIDGVVITIIDITALKRTQEEFFLLEKLTHVINESEDFQAAMKAVLHTVCELTNWTIGEVWLPNVSSSLLERSTSWFPADSILKNFDDASKQFFFEKGTGLPGRAWSTKQVVWVRDVTIDKNFPRGDIARSHGLKAGLGIPVLAKDVVVAVIVFFMYEACEEDEQFIKLVSSVASQLGMAFRRKQAEERLQQFRLLAENIPEAFWVTSQDFSRMLYISPSYETIWGRTCKNLYEQPNSWTDGIHPDDYKRVVASLEKHINSEKPFEEKYRIIRPDGTMRTIHNRAFSIKSSDNKFNSIVGIARDITEHVETQKQLRLLSSAIEQSAEGLAIADLNGYLQFVNCSFANMHGYAPEELRGKHLSIFHTPDQIPSVNASINYLKKNGIFTGEIWHARRDGTVFPTIMNNSLLKDEEGNAIAMIGTLIDITERKKTADDLKKSYNLLQAVINGTPDIIFVKDLELKLIMINSAVCKYLEKSSEEIIGKTSFDILPKEIAEKITENDLAVLRSGKTQTFKEILPGKGNDAKIVLATKSPYLDSNGNIIGLVGISKDITELK
ncbi:MAG: PAS domain S-box protein [Planctomycetes bacterium]|nr:PAS domain S-box protein [Planctomycetota bacterium]